MAGGANSNMGRAFLQQSGMLGNALNAINQAEQSGRSGSPGYVPPSALSQGPIAQPPVQMGSQAAPQMSPFAQQMMQRSMAPQPIMGLPAALMQMQGQLNQPMMRSPMPQYQNPALNYRPDMTQAMQSLNRVQPSVYKTDLDNARARIAELEGQLQPQDTGYYSGGG